MLHTKFQGHLFLVHWVELRDTNCRRFMSHLMTKPTKWLRAQRRLRSAWTSAQSDQSSLCAQWVAKNPSFLRADSKDFDQTGRMPRLIWVFIGRTCHFVGFVMRWLKRPCYLYDMLLLTLHWTIKNHKTNQVSITSKISMFAARPQKLLRFYSVIFVKSTNWFRRQCADKAHFDSLYSFRAYFIFWKYKHKMSSNKR